MLKMADVYVIRHKVLKEGKSQRRVSQELGISRNTISKYLHQPRPVRNERIPRLCPAKDKAMPIIRHELETSQTTRKQKWTSPRMWRELQKQGITLSERSVRLYMAEIRREKAEVYVPLVYKPGELAQVDFFEVTIRLPEGRRKAWMFVMREMYSGNDFVCIYDRQDQICFLDGHVRAFEHFGGIPHRIMYDNLKAAVKKICLGSERELTDSFIALVTHYLFEPVFARPGEGHDKGGVEGRGRGIRWQYLTPLPQGDDLETISRTLQEAIDSRSDEKETKWNESVQRFLLLPPHRFLAQRIIYKAVSASSIVRIDRAKYSVSEQWARRTVQVHIRAREIQIMYRQETVIHPRMRPGEQSIRYMNYLKNLSRKPQALRQVSSELMNELGTPFDTLWHLCVRRDGPLKAARFYKHVLQKIMDDGLEQTRQKVATLLNSGNDIHVLFCDEEAPVQVCVPEALQAIQIETASIAEFDQLLRTVR